jgi:hypothetical protein
MAKAPGHQRVSQARKEKFLVALAKTMNVAAAAKLIGMPYGPAALYEQRAADPEFKKRWEEVENLKLDELEALQWKAALEHREDRRWVLSRRRPGKWSEKHTHGGKVEVEHTLNIKQMSRDDLLKIAQAGAVQADYTIESGEDPASD